MRARTTAVAAAASTLVGVSLRCDGHNRYFAAAPKQHTRKPLDFVVSTPLRFLSEGVCIGEASKLKAGRNGEDAMLLHKLAVGVADGVGGWAEEGVDSGLYSRKLVENATAALEAAEDDGKERTAAVHPWALLFHAHARTREMGSSTLCIALAGPDGAVHVANLGDSGCQHWRHVRPAGMLASGVHFKLGVQEEARLWELKHETKAQTEGFNTPKQLAAGLANGNDPREADVYAWPAQPGDLILAATDGVWDNLSSDDVRHALATVDWSPVHALARMRRVRYLEALKIERQITAPAGAASSSSSISSGSDGAGKGGKVLERFAVNNAIGGDEVDVSNAAVKAREEEVRAILRSLASKLAADAKRVGDDTTRADTPFAKAAKAAGYKFVGGKPDDVTVALALVVHDDSPAAVEAVVAAEMAAAAKKAGAIGASKGA